MSSPRALARMRRLARIVRRVSPTLMLLLIASLALAYIVPQRPGLLDESSWPSTFRPVADFIRGVGLDRVFSTWWFSALLGAVAVASLLALIGQSALAWRRAFGIGRPSGTALELTLESADEVLMRARRHGYLVVRRSGSIVKAVKHPWGHWGTTLLHAGIVVATLASWFALQGTATGVVQLAEEETFAPGQPWGVEDGGSLAGPLVLPAPMTLLSSDAEYWPDGALRQVRSSVRLGTGADADIVDVEVNGSVARGPLRIYQSMKVGATLLITISGPSGEEKVRVDMPAPPSPAVAAYADYPLEDGTTLRLKYFADADRASMNGVPEVIARMESSGTVLGQDVLVAGSTVALGDYDVALNHIRSWTQLIVVRTHAMFAVFAGFAVILLGSFLLYVWPPRELFIATDGATASVWWRAWRFPDVYSDEYERVFGQVNEVATDE